MRARPVSKVESRNTVAIIGGPNQEIQEISKQLNIKSPKGFTFNIESFSPLSPKQKLPLTHNLAIVLTCSGVNSLPSDYDSTLKSIIDSSYCRVYLIESPTIPLKKKNKELVDSFIQNTPSKSPSYIAEEIIFFLKDAEITGNLSNLKGLRDAFYLSFYERSKILWPISYSVILLVVLRSLFPSLILPINGIIESMPFMIFFAFFVAFFVAHSLYVSTRNFLYSTVVLRPLNLLFIIANVAIGLFLVTLATYAVYSTFLSIQSWLVFGLTSGAAFCTYFYCLYARRIRAECTSLSGFEDDVQNDTRRRELAKRIGSIPLSSPAFPFISLPSDSIFISYIRSSIWSKDNAFKLCHEFKELGWEVFLDESSIPFGAAWRQRLQRGVSECSYFVTLVDSEIPERSWVLAESMYAALLRKRIGKPKILLIIKNERQRHELMKTMFSEIYKDILYPPFCKLGGGFFVANDLTLSAELVQRKFDSIKPMQLLPGMYSTIWVMAGSFIFGGLLTIAMLLSFAESLAELLKTAPNFSIWSHLRIVVIGINSLMGAIFGFYSASLHSFIRDRNSAILASYITGFILAICTLAFLTPRLFQNLEKEAIVLTSSLIARFILGFWVGMVGTWAVTLISPKPHH